MMNKDLLVDITMPNTKGFIMEGINDPTKPLIVQGKVQSAIKTNQNGRKYPFKILKREVDNYIENQIKENRAIGELDHPDSSIISLKHGSHNFQKMWWENDNDVYAKVYVLSDIVDTNNNVIKHGTPNGNILRAYFEHGITVGISSRGLGSVKNIDESTVEVQEDYEIICWDFVSNPSTHGAFMKPITENINYEMTLLNEREKSLSKINNIFDVILADAKVKCDMNNCTII